MFAPTRNLSVLAKIGRATTAPARAWSSGLDFVPLDLSVDPLDESARSALAKSCYVRIQVRLTVVLSRCRLFRSARSAFRFSPRPSSAGTPTSWQPDLTSSPSPHPHPVEDWSQEDGRRGHQAHVGAQHWSPCSHRRLGHQRQKPLQSRRR